MPDTYDHITLMCRPKAALHNVETKNWNLVKDIFS